MKILFLGFTNIEFLPYIHFYLNAIDKQEHELHLLYWNRSEIQRQTSIEGIICHSYDCVMADTLKFIQKVPKILGYGKFAKKIINKLNPDFLIVMHSTTAYTIRHLLSGKYKKNYIFDFRDITYEPKSSYYRYCVKRIIENSALSFTSSNSYRKFLPDTNNLLTSHNLLKENLAKHSFYSQRNQGKEPIRIAFWGLIRHESFNRKIVKMIGNDKRFEIHYYGRAQGSLVDFLKEITDKYSNIFYHGEYLPSDREQFSLCTDILHNMFSSEDINMSLAMANKYYDGLLFYLPQLCTKGSYMGSLSDEKHIGLSCSPDDEDFADNIYNYYTSLDFTTFRKYCDIALSEIIQEIEYGEQMIIKTLKKII